MKSMIKFQGKSIVIYHPENDDMCRNSLEHGEFYEKEIIEYLYHNFGHLSGVYVDVGANIGNHVLFFRHFMGVKSIVAIEPNPAAFGYLQSNMRRDNNIFALKYIIGDGKTYSATMNTTNIGHTVYKVTSGGQTSKRLDDILAGNISIIKVDVEGMEDQVIESMASTLDRCSPVLVIEGDRDLMVSKLRNFGYKEIQYFEKYRTGIYTPT